jgi:hypothetical protein
MLQNEIDLFNSSLFEWTLQWASFYCVKDNQATSDFKKDIELYFPTFFENSPIFDAQRQIISFSPLLMKPRFDINEATKEELSKWKFSGPYLKTNSDNAKKFENYSEIDKVFNEKSSLVSLVFWKHIYKPFEYPIFDQRTMRTFSVLNGTSKNFLWIGGVPSGKKRREYYDNVFSKKILSAITQEPDQRKKLIMLRLIDYALFSFDKLIISNIGKELPINDTITKLLDEKIKKHKSSIDKQELSVYKIKI